MNYMREFTPVIDELYQQSECSRDPIHLEQMKKHLIEEVSRHGRTHHMYTHSGTCCTACDDWDHVTLNKQLCEMGYRSEHVNIETEMGRFSVLTVARSDEDFSSEKQMVYDYI